MRRQAGRLRVEVRAGRRFGRRSSLPRRALAGQIWQDSIGQVFSKRWHDLVLELSPAMSVCAWATARPCTRCGSRSVGSEAFSGPSCPCSTGVRQWLRDELGWLGSILGPVRDSDVLRGHLEALLDALPATEVLGPEGRSSTDTSPRHGDRPGPALNAMRSERYLDLLDVLRAVSLAPPLSAKARQSIDKAASRLLHRELERVAERVAAANGYENSSDHEQALHEVRKAAKGMRYAAETFEPVLGKPVRRIAQRFVAIHELLGSGQDAVVARDLLRQLGEAGTRPGHSGYTYGLLAGLEERRFDQAAHKLPALWKAASSKSLWDALDQ